MAINSFLRSASCSIIPLSIRSLGCRTLSHGSISGAQFLPFVRFSTVTGIVSGIRSLFDSSEPGPNQVIPNTSRYPFDRVYFIGANTHLQRTIQGETTTVVVLGDTLKVTDGNPNVSIIANIGKNALDVKFEAIVEPEMIKIHSLNIRDNPRFGHLQFLEKIIDSNGINATTVDILFKIFSKQAKD